MMDEQAYLSGYRAWYQAHIMLMSYVFTEDNGKGKKEYYFLSLSGIYQMLWGALLFTVCEYLKKFPMIQHELKQEINAIYKPLSHYRNAVFHTKKVVNPKEIARFAANTEYADQAVKVHYLIRDYFRTHQFRNLLPPEKIEDFNYMTGKTNF